MHFSEKTALVTGSSRGIGKAIALQLAREGAEVILHCHNNPDEGEAVKREITEGGGKAHLLRADLSNTDEAISLGRDAWAIKNGLDILVNNAGISYKKHFLDTTPEDVSAFLHVNYISAFFLTQTVAGKMVESGRKGSILSITSVNGIRPGLGLTAYGASKAALELAMKGVAMDLAPHGIAVNTVAVGAVDTDMTGALRNDPALLKEVIDGIPVGRLAQPEEIATVVCNLLASGEYLTGSTITVDGGLLLMRGYGKPTAYKSKNQS